MAHSVKETKGMAGFDGSSSSAHGQEVEVMVRGKR